ncbi:hypothetical protein RZS08_58465, partial [Arthrospira platensis SPKY1]|nr:hypothetical protein [Arthrospira platensis SPKY1]
ITLWGDDPNAPGPPLYPRLSAFIEDLEMPAPDPERQAVLDDLADWIRETRSNGENAPLVFICTHNSRRSHLAQIWMATMARYFGLEHVATYSGGTEATAFNPRAV